MPGNGHHQGVTPGPTSCTPRDPPSFLGSHVSTQTSVYLCLTNYLLTVSYPQPEPEQVPSACPFWELDTNSCEINKNKNNNKNKWQIDYTGRLW